MVASTSMLDFKLPNATTWFYFSLLLAVGLFFKFSRLLSIRNLDVIGLFLLVPGLLLVQEAHTPPGSSRPSPAVIDVRLLWFGYLWLMAGSAYFFLRCLVDLALVRRPSLAPNMNFSGLAWMGMALLISLVSVAIRHQEGAPETVGKGTAPLQQAKEKLEALVDQQQKAIAARGV